MLNEFDLKDFNILQEKPVRFLDEGDVFEYMLDVFEVVRNDYFASHVLCKCLDSLKDVYFRADEYVSPMKRKV